MSDNELMIAYMLAWRDQDMSLFSTLCKEAAERDLIEWVDNGEQD